MLVTIVHLSDLHVREAVDAVHAKLRPLAAAICSIDPTCNDYIVVLSGDVAYHGFAEEYVVANSFIRSLTQFIVEYNAKAKVRYIAVPGNHDCILPENEIKLRAALVQAIEPTLQTSAPDGSILESVLSPQKNYFDFADGLGLSTKDNVQKLCNSYTFDIGDSRIRFALYNTALLSTRDEQQGSLLVPIELIKSMATPDAACDLIVSVFHHPYNWLQADIGIAFRDHIEHTSEIVLTGHQHVEHAYMKQSPAGNQPYALFGRRRFAGVQGPRP